MTNEELIQRATALLNEQRVPATNANLSRAIEALSRAGQSLDSTTRNMDDVYERMTRVNAILDNVPGIRPENSRSEHINSRSQHLTSNGYSGYADQGDTPSHTSPPGGVSYSTTKRTPSQAASGVVETHSHFDSQQGRPNGHTDTQVRMSSSTTDRAAELPDRTTQQPVRTLVRNTDNESAPSERREVDEATETYAPKSRREVGTSDTGNPLDAILASALGMGAKSAYDSYNATRPRSGDFIPGSPQIDEERAAIEQAPIEGEVSRTRIPYDPRQIEQQRLLEQQRSLAGPQTIDDVLNEALGVTPRRQLGQPTDMQSETRSVIEAPDESKLSVQHGVPTERRGNVTQSPRRPDVIELGADERPVQQTAKSTADSVVDNAVEQSKATDEASQQKAKRPRSVSDNKERINKLIGDVKDSIGAVDVEVVPGKRGTSRGYFQVTDSRGNILGKYYSAQEMRAAIKDGSLNEAYNAAKSAIGAAAKAVRGIKK